MFSQPLYPVHLAVPLTALPGPGEMGHLPLNLLGGPGRDSTRQWSLPAHTRAQAVFHVHDLWGKMLAFLGEEGEARRGTFPLSFLFKLQEVVVILIFRPHIQCRGGPRGRSPFEVSIPDPHLQAEASSHCVTTAHSLVMLSSAKIAPRMGGENETLSWLTTIALMNGNQIPHVRFH